MKPPCYIKIAGKTDDDKLKLLVFFAFFRKMDTTQTKGGLLFLKRVSLFESPLRGGWGGAALSATASSKGVFSFTKENTPFETPRERLALRGFGLEGLHALRSGGAVYVASPRAFCVSILVATARTP